MIDIIDRIDDATTSVCGWCSRKLGRAAGIPQTFLFGDWTDIGFTTGGVIEATPPDEPPTVATRAERMQAALAARRSRNTGPTRRPRAPKNLGGRTSR